ncbi:hypothetical protein [Streptomyces sp. NBC_01497]|uniref:hypothetical protein n=1 Tax=Streptomyces sp. NBC_01497 TaxID=2903885 RepID=UPI002E3090B8|nr:hypothetical protein [Streptomyces sp. NBC_01497]
MSAIGPVEQGDGAEPDEDGTDPTDTAPPDVVGGRRTTHRTPHRRARQALLAAAALALVGYAVTNTLAHQGRSDRDKTPTPGGIHAVAYRGLTLPTDPADPTFTVRLRITAAPGPPVTVQSLRHPFTALATRSRPASPFTVTEHRPRDVTLAITVENCDATPRDVRLPFLDVTLRKKNVIRKHTEVLDRAYATDVTAAIRTICARQHRDPPKPLSGTAGSHHVNTGPLYGNNRSAHTTHLAAPVPA